MANRIKFATMFSLITTLLLTFEYRIIDALAAKNLLSNASLLFEVLKFLGSYVALSFIFYMVVSILVKSTIQATEKLHESPLLTQHEPQLKEDRLQTIDAEFTYSSVALCCKKEDAEEPLSLRNQQRLNELFADTVTALSKAIQAKDPYTAAHSEHVKRYSCAIAIKVGLSEKDTYALGIGALLHDIGKIGVSEQVLKKQERLTENEYREIQCHPEYGFNIIKDIDELRDQSILPIVLYHHERLDGNGYPFGLSADEIPQMVRIVSVCDAFDAMTTSRSYRSAMSLASAIEQLQKNAGTQFDAEIVNVFIQCLSEDPTLYVGDGAQHSLVSIS